MAFDPENPHKWFTAGEVAELARVQGIAEVPTTKSGMIKWIKRNVAHDLDFAELSRKRLGQKGGGGTEYYWALFCEAGPDISDALDAEVARREAAAMAARAEPAGGMFTPEDEQLMRDAASDLYGHISRFEYVGVRRVRRSRIRVHNREYYSPCFAYLEGKAVLTVVPVLPPPRPVFAWACEPETGRLSANGETGFIGMTEAADEPEGIKPGIGLHSFGELE